MVEDRKGHWNKVYSNKSPEELTWFQARPEASLSLIRNAGIGPEARIIDVGGGTSLLSATLLEEGFVNLSVLDVSDRALEAAKSLLGPDSPEIEWFTSDLTDFEPPHRWDLWHDRAVYHFLTGNEDRHAYRRVLNESVEPGGHVVVATFALDGPERCSGLEVVRYSPESLHAELGTLYELCGTVNETHRTPGGGTQEFVYSWFRKLS